MTLVRWQPKEIGSIHSEIDRLSGNAWPRRNGGSESPVWRPAADVSESEDAWTLTLDLPGVSREAIKVSIEQGVLTIEGEKTRKESEIPGDDRWSERLHGSFRRRFTLPEGADPGKVSADYKDGVLTVTLPKAEVSRPREIAVEIG